MSLNWNWSEKMGDCVYENGAVSTLYQGNALVIAINEYPDETYQLAWFASDEAHMRNMLGLTKGYDNIVTEWGIEKIRLDTRFRSTQKLVALLAKANFPITIELYKGEAK